MLLLLCVNHAKWDHLCFYRECREYIERLILYKQPIWACKITHKQNLTYFEALDSENQAKRQIENFPEHWKSHVLWIIQFCSLPFSTDHMPKVLLAKQSVDALAGVLVNFCRNHYAAGEKIMVR